MEVYLSAPEAAAFLGVAQPTLYAYVSRGFVRSQPGIDSRSRAYNRIDLEQLRARKRIRNRPQAEVAEALHWGAPLLDSALTLITNESLYYRGLNALELAVSRSFWQVACWFWTGDWGARFAESEGAGRVRRGTVDNPFERQQAWLIERAHSDPSGYQLAMPFAGATGASIVRHFLAFLTGSLNPSLDDASSELARSWCRHPRRAAPVLSAILILALDHEINVSSFAARVVASAGSNLYEIVSAAMCAFSGSRHGRISERADQFISDLENTRSASELVHARLRSGEEIPGFGHPLYPEGDPRARLILKLLQEAYPGEFAKIHRKIADTERVIRKPANIDLAIACSGRILALPAHSGFHLFALGRTVGWIAHAIEQHQSGSLIRPRARYVGALP